VRGSTALLAYQQFASGRWNAIMPETGAQVFVTYSFTEAADLPTTADYSPFDA
jgi:hypothetical protein